MGVPLPEYDWVLDEAFQLRIRMFSQILTAMTDERVQPCEMGTAYMNSFYAEMHTTNPFDPEDYPYIDIEPLEKNMLEDSLGFAGMCVSWAADIVDFAKNVHAVFPEESWRAQVDGEIRLHGQRLERIASDMKKTMAFHDPENLPYDNIRTYREYLDRLGYAESRYEALVGDRSVVLTDQPAKGSVLDRAFNIAGKRTMLSIEALRYATCAMVVVEDTMQILLGIAVMSEARRSTLAAHTRNLQELAERMMLVAKEAMDEGQTLTRDSYKAQEYQKPVFQSVSGINHQYSGYRPR